MATTCPHCHREFEPDDHPAREGFGVLQQVWRRNRELERRVAERTAALQAANAELRRLSRVFEDVAAPIVLADLDGRITDLNPAAEEFYGWTRDELLGRSLLSFVPEQRHDEAIAVLERVRGGEKVQAEGKLVGKSGAHHEVVTTLSLLTDADDRPAGIASLSKDISELKETQRMLHLVNDELKSLVVRDALTQLPNRRFFDRTFEREVRRAARTGDPIAVLMIDIDHYKAFNDALGHQAGDECLRVIARLLGACVQRPGDFVARYGGEEFAAVLPETDHRGAALLAERIRGRVERQAIEHPASPLGPVVTVSVGVAAARVTPRLRPEVLLRAADRALYRAKAAGRNRIHIAHLPSRDDGAAGAE